MTPLDDRLKEIEERTHGKLTTYLLRLVRIAEEGIDVEQLSAYNEGRKNALQRIALLKTKMQELEP